MADVNLDFLEEYLGLYDHKGIRCFCSAILNAEIEVHRDSKVCTWGYICKYGDDTWRKKTLLTFDEDVIDLVEDPWGLDLVDLYEF